MNWSEYSKIKNDPDEVIKNECYAKVMEFFKDENKAGLWMESINPLLGQVSPIEMMRIKRHKKLLDFINNQLEANK